MLSLIFSYQKRKRKRYNKQNITKGEVSLEMKISIKIMLILKFIHRFERGKSKIFQSLKYI